MLLLDTIVERWMWQAPKGFWRSLGFARFIIKVCSLSMWLTFIGFAIGFALKQTGVVAISAPIVVVCWLIPIPLGMTARIAYRLSKKAFCRTLEKRRYEVCFECGYDLAGLPATHMCPECGVKYEKFRLQAVWKQWAGGPPCAT